ncbi:hypothetical protein CHS0354_037712 [Potamilus streckersoni]|uniref:Protein tincar n=1 Tax=Potamilus streckersoni TaxID=2493646 RepID=A0AAE0T082_9BIVA|nr:hypothetical protein CHS0354_037712 [Potamilus streckersoni]
MVQLVKKSTRLTSLWSIFYCLIVLGLHCYITYVFITRYRGLNSQSVLGDEGNLQSVFKTSLALVILSLLCLPLFVITSVVRVGNTANDGVKLGRDHALETNVNTIGSKIKCHFIRRIWQQFLPFSQLLHLCAAILVLLPETMLTAAEVEHGLKSTDAVWSCDLDFFFAADRPHRSDIISRSNLTHHDNMTYIIIPTPRPPSGGWSNHYTVSVSYVHFAIALLAFTVRYASVFWFTNKVISFIFAFQLLFLSIESIFAFCGMSVLYKLTINSNMYVKNIHTALGSSAVMALYIIGGIILILSTMAVYDYGACYFQEKFQIIDQKHHPDTYKKQTIVVKSGCQGYKTHILAIVALIIMALFKGPILYDLVGLYKVAKDSLVLTCVIVDVCYMVMWITLWTVFTLKQEWKFRILDYVPLTQPIFTISNEHTISKSLSFPAGSLELSEIRKYRRKRPSSLPSDLTASESGFGDVPSSEDERFEVCLPPLDEYPGIESSRKKGSTQSLNLRGRNRRNGHQRVTFHETVKRCTSTDDESSPKRSIGNIDPDGNGVRVQADIHLENSRGVYQFNPVEKDTRKAPRIDVNATKDFQKSLHSKEEHLNNSYCTTNSEDDGSAFSEPISSNRLKRDCTSLFSRSVNSRDKTSKLDQGNKQQMKISNVSNNLNIAPASVKQTNLEVTQRINQNLNSRDLHLGVPSPNRRDISIFMETKATSENENRIVDQLYPRPIEFVDKKQILGLERRDSANYSLTSSQETASNDSDQSQNPLCSQHQNIDGTQP